MDVEDGITGHFIYLFYFLEVNLLVELHGRYVPCVNDHSTNHPVTIYNQTYFFK